MVQALHGVEARPDHSVEIIVHLTEHLGEKQRQELVAALQEHTGIDAVEFCPLRYHLMLIRYDRDSYTSQDVLDRVKKQNLDARLIGPV